MKENCFKKILLITLTIMTIFSLWSTKVYAGDDDFVGEADDFLHAGAENVFPEETIQNMSDTIYNILLVVATIIAVIWGAVIGVQYILGSVSEKVKVKESLIPYVAGCIVVFGAFTIWKIVVTILQNAT